MVIADLDITGANKVVAEVEKAGGSVYSSLPPSVSADLLKGLLIYRTASAIKCNVTEWEAQVEMFELAIKKYGSVDIVVCTSYAITCHLTRKILIGPQRWNYRS